MGMKSNGWIRPYWGWRQRSRASKPIGGTAAQIHYGLVEHRHLIPFQGMMEIDRHCHADVSAMAQLRIECFPAVAAFAPGLEHSDSGVAQEFGGDGVRVGAEGDSGAGTHGNLRTSKMRGRERQDRSVLASASACSTGAGFQQKGEFVGAHACQHGGQDESRIP